MASGADYLAQVLADQPDRRATRVGVVTQVTPLVVNFRGALLRNLGKPSWYTPVVGHVVTLERQDQTWMCTGRVLPA